jgi:Flp pilus assembly protein TadG
MNALRTDCRRIKEAYIPMQATATLRHERGATLVEYALAVAILLVFVLGIIEFARIIFTYNTLANAAREGARYGISHANDTAGVEGVTRALSTGLDGTLLTIQTTWSSDAVQVRVDYPVHLVTGPFIQAIGGISTIHVRAVSRMQLE